jgi:hypothetical protein
MLIRIYAGISGVHHRSLDVLEAITSVVDVAVKLKPKSPRVPDLCPKASASVWPGKPNPPVEKRSSIRYFIFAIANVKKAELHVFSLQTLRTRDDYSGETFLRKPHHLLGGSLKQRDKQTPGDKPQEK